ncbi:MAG: dTDP-glucose 4,6-dehydratase [Candidatus Ozemobacteraceae bacterium]
MRSFKNLLVTGGSGFIGANFIHYLFGEPGFAGRLINLDKLTYAGNPENLARIVETFGERYVFAHGDICDADLVTDLVKRYEVDGIVHFAAESHVDRSILGPKDFIQTNILGTFTLLEVARQAHQQGKPIHFHHVSTDEVFGSLGEQGFFFESTPYAPRSPYSASKASSDHLVAAYHHTYGLPVTVSNCSNNYGPYQFPEKLIPLMILNMLEKKSLPIYGDGLYIRDWLYVTDHCEGIWAIATKGRNGETYNIGGENEKTNLAVLDALIAEVACQTSDSADTFHKLKTTVPDRPGHDRRYAINCDKIASELGWRPRTDFSSGIEKTVRWYLSNPAWIDHVRSGAYKTWLDKNYTSRGDHATSKGV